MLIITIENTSVTVTEEKTGKVLSFDILLYRTCTDWRQAPSRRQNAEDGWLRFWAKSDLENMAKGIFGAWVYRGEPSEMSFAWYTSVFAIGNMRRLDEQESNS